MQSLFLPIKILISISIRIIRILALTVKVEITMISTFKTIKTISLDRISIRTLQETNNSICKVMMQLSDTVNLIQFIMTTRPRSRAGTVPSGGCNQGHASNDCLANHTTNRQTGTQDWARKFYGVAAETTSKPEGPS